MKKEDYMKLPKRRLAELLEERDNEQKLVSCPPTVVLGPSNQSCLSPDGICTNPFHDCINCPR